LVSSGFRAPNVDDVAKVFDSEPGAVVVSNTEAKPEYSYNVEYGISRSIKEFNPPKFFLALPQTIFNRVWQRVDNGVKEKLFRYLDEDLTKMDKNRLPEIFQENSISVSSIKKGCRLLQSLHHFPQRFEIVFPNKSFLKRSPSGVPLTQEKAATHLTPIKPLIGTFTISLIVLSFLSELRKMSFQSPKVGLMPAFNRNNVCRDNRVIKHARHCTNRPQYI